MGRSHQQEAFLYLSRVLGVMFDAVSVIFMVMLFGIIFWRKGYKKEAMVAAAVMFSEVVAVFVTKLIVHRARPLNIVGETGYSFPSGHAAAAMVFFGLIIYFTCIHAKSKKIKVAVVLSSIFMMISIGASRIYLNAHWASDVIAGFSVGLFILTMGILVRDVFENWKLSKE